MGEAGRNFGKGRYVITRRYRTVRKMSPGEICKTVCNFLLAPKEVRNGGEKKGV